MLDEWSLKLMKKFWFFSLFVIVFLVFSTLQSCEKEADQTNKINKRLLALGHQKLSDYGFFEGDLADLNPIKGVIPYDLNTPLFSDYAYKSRFIQVPDGKTAAYNETDVLVFPVGTHIIKTFYFPNDFRDESQGRRLLETRILIHKKTGWKSLPYIWNNAQTNAFLEITGGTKTVHWIHSDGAKRTTQYSIPTMVQCKSCHIRNETLLPIGPTIRQLNREFDYAGGRKNQLVKFTEEGILDGLPPLAGVPKSPVWNDPATGSLHKRAMAYLDINCGHCHNPNGPGNTSALVLTMNETEPVNWGVFKKPVAAGRGSGGRSYSIVPGKPDESILLFRMESTDPGIMMPEVGRKLMHREGVALIKEWIAKMEQNTL
mgnify:CR=1 FL=1